MTLEDAMRLRPVRRLAYTVAAAELDGWVYNWDTGGMSRPTPSA